MKLITVVTSAVLTAADKDQVFWDVMQCQLANSYQLFEGAKCLHFQVQAVESV